MSRKARGEEHRVWVVYSDIFEPLEYGGWPLDQAFSNLLKHVGFAPEWSVAPAARLELRFVGGGKAQLPTGPHAYPDRPPFTKR